MSGSKSSVPGVAPASEAEIESPVSFTVHSMPQPDLASRRTTAGRWKMLAVLLVCASPVIASYFTYFVIKPQARTNYSELVTPPVATPATLPLRRLSGEAVDASSLRGQWLLIVVGGGACDSECESHLLLQRQLVETLGREKDRVDKIWFVTDAVAPRPEVLRAIEVGQSAIVLSVDAAALGSWLAPATSRRIDEHLYLVDPMGQWMMRTPVNPDPARLKRDIERLLRASSSWDQPGR